MMPISDFQVYKWNRNRNEQPIVAQSAKTGAAGRLPHTGWLSWNPPTVKSNV